MRKIISSPLHGFLLVALVSFVIFLTTMPRYLTGYADSDEFITVGYFAGLAHPPGYPLYSLLLFVFTHLPLPFLTIIEKSHLLSVVLTSLTLGFVYLSAFSLYAIKKNKKDEESVFRPELTRFLVSIFTTTGLLLTRTFYLYGQMTEKFALNNLFGAIILYLLIKLSLNPLKKNLNLIYALVFTFSLSLTHHQTTLFWLLPIGYLAYLNRKVLNQKTIYIKSAIALIIPLILYSTILLAIAAEPPQVSWNMPPNLSGVVSFITRQDFSGAVYQQGLKSTAYPTKIDINRSFNSLVEYLKLSISHVGIYYLFLLPLIASKLLKKDRQDILLIAISFLSTGIILASYITYNPQSAVESASTQRQYILSYIPLALLAFFGYQEYFRRFSKALKEVTKNTLGIKIVLISLPVLILSYRAYTLFPDLNLKNFNVVNTQYQNSLNNLPQNSVLTCYSDPSCFAYLYLQNVAKVRPDVSLAPLHFPLVINTINNPNLRGFTYDKNPYLFLDIITWNLDKRPVYASDISDYYISFLGLDYPFIYYMPKGDVGEFTKSVPKEIVAHPLSDTSLLWKNTRTPHWDTMRVVLKTNFAHNYFMNAYQYLKMNQRPLAQQEMTKGIDLYYQLTSKDKAMANILRSQMEQITAQTRFLPGTKVDDSATLIKNIATFLDAKQNAKAYQAARGAVMVDPTSVAARLSLADIYEKMGDNRFAIIEYTHALLLDPQNQLANEKLATLSL